MKLNNYSKPRKKMKPLKLIDGHCEKANTIVAKEKEGTLKT